MRHVDRRVRQDARRTDRRLGASRVRVVVFVLAVCGAVPVSAASLEGAPGFDAVVLPIDESAAERDYADALALIERQRYREALAALRRVQASHPAFSQLSAVQTRIAVLHEARDAGAALPVFLGALADRDAGRLDEALQALDALTRDHPDSVLLDDALYLGAYLSVMDGYDFTDARRRLAQLADGVPDSAYADSALYLSGIVHEQLGDTAAARATLVQLRDRHTALGLPFGFRWPVGTLLSRYWFDRAERRITIIDARLRDASRVDGSARLGDGRLRVAVQVDGRELQLLLEPSALVRDTAWRNAYLVDREPPSVGVYEGVVEGEADSWVRATIDGGAITGMIGIDGERLRLLPAHLSGTLDYYQPAPRGAAIGAPGGLDPTDAGLAGHLQAIDLMVAPPRPESPDQARRARQRFSTTREVPLSIVIDSRFDGYHGGAGLARALDYLNVADGVYRDHGLSIALDEAVVFTDSADPLKLSPGTLESILRRFRAYRLAHADRFDGSAATYLFTGNRKTDATLGLAWIDTLCRIDGYDVGVTTPSSFGDVLLTHELGHSFGAQHDSDTACAADGDALMWPHISERTGTRLTRCSRASVQTSRAQACLSNTVDLTLAAGITDEAAVFSISHTESGLDVDARLVVEASAPGQVDWPAGCRVVSPTSADCAVSDLASGEPRQVTLPLLGGASASSPLAARVSPVNIAELRPADNTATTDGGAPNFLTDASAKQDPGGDPSAEPVAQAPVRAGSPGQPASGGSSGGAIHPLALGWLATWRLCRRHRRRGRLFVCAEAP